MKDRDWFMLWVHSMLCIVGLGGIGLSVALILETDRTGLQIFSGVLGFVFFMLTIQFFRILIEEVRSGR